MEEDHASLARRFAEAVRARDAAAGDARAPARVGDAELGRAIASAIEAGRAAWPEIDMPVASFVAFLAEKLPREALATDAAAAVGSARAADLWLVRACALGDAKAIATLEARYGSAIVAAARRRAEKGGLADDAKQILFARLFVSDDGAPPRIVDYAGRGDLAAFLRVAAARVALNLLRGERRRAAASDAARAEPPPLDDPELARVAARYHDDFRAALRDAAGDLTTRERNLLRQHHIDGLTMVELATMYGLHRVTVVRAIQAAREKLAAGTRERLRERLRLDVAELESLFRVVAANLDLSIQRYLATAG